MIPKIQPMETPVTRAEFELRLHHLVENLKNGKVHYPSDIVESLLRLRLLPNGRLDFLSVDETARLQANTVHTFINMREIFEDLEQKIPPSDG
ncbi:hypothetical protein J2W70_000250 [Pseudomonas koreensis]|uniref:AVAST type 1 anti-phage system protein Avs1c n=1 Tax=Pseudomonas koreensis TaxID=198620 RepID=UPI00285EA16E|nr:AVAST type 1 anti-phage system protein Avs1c [Pseudomonas koreensis]MDR7052906.1 hypothetical protein [Pseudomonas koreensis]